ncbi:MAG TPA: lytic transglycosylase domain-containing protein [Thermodesulfobacteriaceae bacterium]|nr:lytic transglycosylase domain-containing protein [Thermodesulfobacteriaceae bacterium]
MASIQNAVQYAGKLSSILLVLTVILCPIPARCGAVYSYVDSEGHVWYTNIAFPSYGSSEKHQRISSPARYKKKIRPAARQADYTRIIREAGKYHGIDPDLIRAIIYTESHGDVFAYSRQGAMGLMQLMPGTALELKVSNPFNPKANIWGGAKYLRRMLKRFNGNVVLAIAAYNAGPGAVEKHNGIPPFDETRKYVRKVLKLWYKFRDRS